MNYTLVEDLQGFQDMVVALGNQGHVVALDTETTGLDPLTKRLLMVQFGIPGYSWVVDARRVSLAAIGEYVGGRQYLGQNLKFDCKFLLHHTGGSIKIAGDTMLAEQVLMAGIKAPYALEHLVTKYTGHEMEKAIRLSFIGMGNEPFTEAQLRYAVRDVQILFEVHEKQHALLKEAGLLSTYKLERAVSPVVAAMELQGMLVDQAKWRRMLSEAVPLKEQFALDLNTALGGWQQMVMFGNDEPTINLNSPTQLLKAFRKIGVGLEDTKARTLELNREYPEVDLLLKYRSKEKLLTSFGEGFLTQINPATGRIHGNFNQNGTDTGRFSSSGPNLQQMPKGDDLRSCFVAPEGYVLVDSDYSGQELRILAHLSGDEALAAAFQAKKDVHSATAALMYNIPLESVTKTQRSASKILGFGLIYGRGPKATADQLKVSLEDAQSLIDQYFSAYPGVSRWLNTQKRNVQHTWESRTALGRRRLYSKPDLMDIEYNKKLSGIQRRATNSPIQGTGADLIKLSLVYVSQNLPKGAQLIATIHDEIVVQCKQEDSEQVKDLMEHWMRKAGEQLIPSVPVEVGSNVAEFWSH